MLNKRFIAEMEEPKLSLVLPYCPSPYGEGKGMKYAGAIECTERDQSSSDTTKADSSY